MNKKDKKILIRILSLVCVFIGFNLICNKSYGAISLGGIVAAAGVIGLGMIFVYALQLVMVIVGFIGQALLNGLLDIKLTSTMTGIRSIFFNRNPLTTAAYFTDSFDMGIKDKSAIWESGSVMSLISQKITEYYYVLRNLSIAILLFILLYIAIRMATSTLSADEAKYKKMLTNWAVSLALVFVLHYIMIITFFVNNTLVTVLEGTIEADSGLDYKYLMAEALVPFAGFGEAIIFLMIVGMEITFLFMYIKRIIVLGFLILIAPLITITYSIDKIGDGKSQALNNWLKEFIYNVIIQPFHCILYITMISTVVQQMADQEKIGSFIIYIIILQFVKEAEEIIKKIFNIQAGSMPGIRGMGTVALGAMAAFGKLGKTAGAVSGKKMPEMSAEAGAGASAAQGVATTAEQGAASAADAASAASTAGSQAGNAASTAANGRPTMPNLDETGGRPTMPEIDVRPSMPTIDTPAHGLDTNANATTAPIEPMIVGDSSSSTSADMANRVNQVTGGESIGKQLGSELARGFVGAAKFFGGQDVTARKVIGAAAKYGSAIGMAGIGLGMGDLNSAMGLGMASYGISNKIESAIDQSKRNQQLEANEEIYDQNYANYVERYRQIAGENVSEDEIRDNLTSLFDLYDDNLIDYKDIEKREGKAMADLQREFLNKSYAKLRDSYEAAGGEKPSDLTKSHTNNASSVKFRESHGE